MRNICVCLCLMVLLDRAFLRAETPEAPLSADLQKVRLQLKWKHQFQFAGYYAAKELGYYQEAGLDVEFLEKNEDGHGGTARDVLQGKAEFGVGMSDIILNRARGDPLVVLASIYQHSPLVLLAVDHGNNSTVHSLAGGRIMLEDHSEEILAYFTREGIRSSDITILPHMFSPQKLISGEVDAVSAYSTDEPFLLQQAGVAYHRFSPRSGGIDFYGDCLFTTEEMIRENPEIVRKFREASLRGWQYALENPDAIVEVIFTQYTQRHSREHLLFEAEQSRQLILPYVVELGYMNPGRWKHIADVYEEFQLLQGPVNLDGFLYATPASSVRYQRLMLLSGIASVIAAFAAYLAWRFLKLNRLLRKEIAERKHAQNEAHERERQLSVLLHNLPGMAYRCEVSPEWTMLFMSEGARRLTGHPPEDFIGSTANLNYGQLIHPEDRLRVWNSVEKAIQEDGHFAMEYRLINARNEIRWVWEQGERVLPNEEHPDSHFLEGFIADITPQKHAELEREQLIEQLMAALREIRQLRGILPICAHCKKIRDDKGYWNQIETYIRQHTSAEFSHSICPDCVRHHYPEYPMESLE